MSKSNKRRVSSQRLSTASIQWYNIACTTGALAKPKWVSPFTSSHDKQAGTQAGIQAATVIQVVDICNSILRTTNLRLFPTILRYLSLNSWLCERKYNTVVYDKVCRMSPPMLRIKQQRHQHKRDGFVLRSRLKSVNVRVAKHTGLPSFYSKLICTGQQRRSFDTRTTCWHWDHHCLLHCTTRGHVCYWSTSTVQVRKTEIQLMSS